MTKKLKMYVLLFVFLVPILGVKAEGLNNKLAGKILLQVESHGEAWYVNPDDNKRYAMGKPEDALALMRKFGLGVSNDNFDDFENQVPERLSGKILIKVEDNGKAYYVNPGDLKLHYMGKPEDALKLMRELGLGISNDNLEKIEVDEDNQKENKKEELKEIALDFITNYLTQADTKIDILEITEDESALYRLKVAISGQIINSYISADGKKFFPQVIDIEEYKKEKENSQDQNKVASGMVSTKKDKPDVELFVMSHCPYGAQIEKGILPVLETLGNNINFELKFVDYAMHGKKELDEQLNQYCIQKLEKERFLDYLDCFLEAGETQTCLYKIDVDQEAIQNCIDETDKEYKITEGYEDETTWLNGRFPNFGIDKEDVDKYDVMGSPTLIINGDKISSPRDSNSLLKMICSGFVEEIEECSRVLSGELPSPGFGYEKTTNNNQDTCS